MNEVGNIIKNVFPLKENENIESIRSSLMNDLAVWESQLPGEMQCHRSGSMTGVKFWSSMLHIAYKYTSLLSRSQVSSNSSLATTLYYYIGLAMQSPNFYKEIT